MAANFRIRQYKKTRHIGPGHHRERRDDLGTGVGRPFSGKESRRNRPPSVAWTTETEIEGSFPRLMKGTTEMAKKVINEISGIVFSLPWLVARDEGLFAGRVGGVSRDATARRRGRWPCLPRILNVETKSPAGLERGN
jgi:hypothetical protein